MHHQGVDDSSVVEVDEERHELLTGQGAQVHLGARACMVLAVPPVTCNGCTGALDPRAHAIPVALECCGLVMRAAYAGTMRTAVHMNCCPTRTACSSALADTYSWNRGSSAGGPKCSRVHRRVMGRACGAMHQLQMPWDGMDLWKHACMPVAFVADAQDTRA